MKLKVVVNV